MFAGPQLLAYDEWVNALQIKKNIDTKSPVEVVSQETGSNAPSQTSTGFSASILVEDTFGPSSSYAESKWKMALLFETKRDGITSIPHSAIFDEIQEANKQHLFGLELLTEDIVELYNLIILRGESYTRINLSTGDELPPSPTLSFADLMSQSFPKARYTLEPFFEQGTVNMVSAPPNTWKSWLLFLCASRIAKGTELFGKFPTEQSSVMIVNEEDSFRAIQDRFRILGVTQTDLPMYFRVANGSKLESKFIDKLLEEVKEKHIGVVIFDSLRSMHEADENDSTAMQKILDQMKRISREGITVIFTHHHRKKSPFEKGSTPEASRGSSAINAAVSGHISLDEEERETGLYLVIRHLKSKAGEKLPAFEVKIVKDEIGGHVEFVYDGEFKQAEKKLKQVKDQIMELLKDGKWKSKKDFEEIKSGDSTMRQAFQALKNEGMIVSITRKQAIAKSIPVHEKGKANESYYSLNTESAEAVMMVDEIIAQQEFESL